MLKRYSDWDLRLNNEIESLRNAPFSWKTHHCVGFVGRCVHAMTGVNILEGVVLEHKTKAGTIRAVNQYAGGYIEEAASKIAEKFNIPDIDVPFAKRGDVCLLKVPVGQVVGIIDLSGRRVVGPDFEGLGSYPVSEATRAWQIG